MRAGGASRAPTGRAPDEGGPVTETVLEGTMRAMRMTTPGPVGRGPLELVEAPIPQPGPGEVLIRVHACGVCHTDLHIAEGDLAPHREGVVPGHEIVGQIVAFGDWPGGDRPQYEAADGRPLELGEWVGVPWLWRTCGRCHFCLSGRENLCDDALFTGWDVDGGFAEYHVATAAFVYRLHPPTDDSSRGGDAADPAGRAAATAPLLCAGVIGYRCLRLAGVVDDRPGLPGEDAAASGASLPTAQRTRAGMRRARLRQVSGAIHDLGGSPVGAGPLDMVDGMAVTEQETRGRLGLFGFGAAAHLCVQIAAHRGWEVYVFTRGEEHRRLALELGATWAGASGQRPGAGSDRGETVLGAAVVFAPVGDLAVEALKVVDKGGVVALGGIHSTPIPSFDYQLIYGERVLRSVTNSTRLDAIELLRTAAAIPVRTEVERFPLEKANDALRAVKESRVRGAAVLQIA